MHTEELKVIGSFNSLFVDVHRTCVCSLRRSEVHHNLLGFATKETVCEVRLLVVQRAIRFCTLSLYAVSL